MNLHDELNALKDALFQQRDEIKLQMNLAGMEARDEWKRTEQKLENYLYQHQEIASDARIATEDTVTSLKKIGAEILGGYEQIKKALHVDDKTGEAVNSSPLAAKHCTPCQGGIAPLVREEAEKLLAMTPQWSLTKEDSQILREFRFPNFMSAMAFAQRVGDLCESQGHHPDISFGWGYCKVRFQTHKIQGLHENDFIMAANVDGLLR
jgi:4a-hydroxytetrahydrobiopterin dehydratase